ncbi:MAG TPA: GntR family transcriptional regulator, partial [Bryobacteraceae bacterium]|nr:GntR family transcriptional regulator [Bryobacteraceae bacterium]
PGQRLVERAIAESTSTSQASVREALQVLEQEGLVTKKTNSASFVTDLSADRLREILSVRMQLEPYAVWLGSRRLTAAEVEALGALVESIRQHAVHQDLYTCSREDFDFHRRLWQASGNEVLTRLLTQICTSYFAYTSLLPGLKEQELDERFGSHESLDRWWRAGLTTCYEQHRQLLDIVLSKDRQSIEAAVKKHMLEGWLWLFKDQPEQFGL